MSVTRSPRALAFDPQATRLEWVTDRPLAGDDFLAALRDVGAWDDEAWERLRRHGGIHVDRRRIEPESAPGAVPAGSAVVAYALRREPEPLRLDASVVLLDEAGIVAVDKPPFWTVQGTRASCLSSLERALRALLRCPTLTPVHRLDRETTGMLLFARDGDAAGWVGTQLLRRAARKEYLAVVHPPPEADEWTVAGRLVRVPHVAHSLFELAPPSADGPGKHSRTRFRVGRRAGETAWVEAEPLTGRTHQIRVHLAVGGTPVVGDALYGRGYAADAPWSADRCLLHAASLLVSLRPGDPPRTLHAPVPADMGWAWP